MNRTEAQHYVRTHNCGCGNALSFRVTGEDCEILCPGNPDHKEHVRIPTPTEQWKSGQQLHPSVARNIERRMGVNNTPGQLDSKALMIIGETAIRERFEVAMKANFGFSFDHTGKAKPPSPGEIKALVTFCATYGLDPLRHEVVLFGGNPLVGLDAYRRKATETGDYLGCTHKPVTSPDVKTALGYQPEDIVDECTVKRLVKGHVAEFSRYGGVRKKEIEATAQSGGARYPVLAKCPAEMAQNRAEKHALRAAFQFTFKDAEPEEDPIDIPICEVGEGTPASDPQPPVTEPAPTVIEPHPVSSGATDGQGQQPSEQSPLPAQEEQLTFADSAPKPEPYTIPDKLLPSQFQFLMNQMQITNKAQMNKVLGLRPTDQFQGTPKDAVDAVFSALLAKGAIPAEIKHWAMWLQSQQ